VTKPPPSDKPAYDFIQYPREKYMPYGCPVPNTYWDELAGQCLTAIHNCTKGCPQKMDFDPNPSKTCQCVDIKKIKKKYFPSWATDSQMAMAEFKGVTHM